MNIDISALVLLKMALVVLGTYFILPLVLVGRDFLLWSVIDKFILTDKLKHKVKVYSEIIEQWNNDFTKDATILNKNNITKYLIDSKEVTLEEHNNFTVERNQLNNIINEYSWYIEKRSNMISWLLKHYKHGSENPIPKWLKTSRERAKTKNAKNNS